MNDQVDKLVKHGIYSAVALNGLLTPPERRSAQDKIRHDDAGIVLVSPEQFRNKSFVEAIRSFSTLKTGRPISRTTRRLLYVAMTRAKATLILFQAAGRGNPMVAGLDELEAVRRVEPKVVPLPLPELNRLHRALTLADSISASPAARMPTRPSIRPLQRSTTGTHCVSTIERSWTPRGAPWASLPGSASCRPALCFEARASSP